MKTANETATDTGHKDELYAEFARLNDLERDAALRATEEQLYQHRYYTASLLPDDEYDRLHAVTRQINLMHAAMGTPEYLHPVRLSDGIVHRWPQKEHCEDLQSYIDTIRSLFDILYQLNLADTDIAQTWQRPSDANWDRAFGHIYDAIVAIAGQEIVTDWSENGSCEGADGVNIYLASRYNPWDIPGVTPYDGYLGRY